MCSYSAKIDLLEVLREWNLPVIDEADFQKNVAFIWQR